MRAVHYLSKYRASINLYIQKRVGFMERLLESISLSLQTGASKQAHTDPTERKNKKSTRGGQKGCVKSRVD